MSTDTKAAIIALLEFAEALNDLNMYELADAIDEHLSPESLPVLQISVGMALASLELCEDRASTA